MPTTQPRVNVTFQSAELYDEVERLSKAKRGSMSDTVQGLVSLALEFIEDIALADLGKARLASFKPEESLDIDEVIEWNDKRKPRKVTTRSK